MRKFLQGLAIQLSSNVIVSDSLNKLLASLSSSGPSDVLVFGLGGDEYRGVYRDEVLVQVRRQFAGPIVLLAGMELTDINALEDECARFGPLYVRSKPIRRERLQKVIRQAKNYHEGRRAESTFDLPNISKSNHLQGAKILVAEDNEFNRNLICAIVEAEGGVAVAARDGVEVLKEINAQPVDLVLMDLNMPRLSGRQAVEEMRRSDQRIAKTPVIALTAEVFEDEGHGLLEDGFDRVLFKPLDERLLIESIIELLAANTELAMPTLEQDSIDSQSFLSRLPPALLGKEISRQLKLLSVAQHNRDLTAIRGQAHQLRSVLYGLDNTDDVVSLVKALEVACEKGDYDTVANIFNSLDEKLNNG